MTTARSENSRKVSGWDVMCRSCRMVLNSPLRQRNGIQAMVRMMPEVQKGIAQSKNSTVRVAALRTWWIRNQAMPKPRNRVIAQTVTANFSELR
jgi:hypothetical protein